MKTKLKQDLEPYINKFVEELEKKLLLVAEKELGVENDRKGVADLKDTMRAEQREQRLRVKAKLDALSDEIAKSKRLQTELQDEVAKNNQINTELGKKLRAINASLESAESERKLALAERERQMSLTKIYEQKIQLLDADFNKANQRTKDLDERERVVSGKERNSDKREQAIISREHVLGEMELDIKTRKKRVDLEYKKLKLEELGG